MLHLNTINTERNNNPHYLNLLLKYPNLVYILEAVNIDVYGLDEKTNPGSVHHVKILALKTSSFV